jgi:hypothetical protein
VAAPFSSQKEAHVTRQHWPVLSCLDWTLLFENLAISPAGLLLCRGQMWGVHRRRRPWEMAHYAEEPGAEARWSWALATHPYAVP